MVAGAGGFPDAGGVTAGGATGTAGTAVVDAAGAFAVGAVSVLVIVDVSAAEGHSVVYR